MTAEEEITLLLRAVIPIDDIDQIISPGLSLAVIWMDISERPDLQVLREQDTLTDGYSICTFFYANPGQHTMRLGLRVEMRQPVHFVLPLVVIWLKGGQNVGRKVGNRRECWESSGSNLFIPRQIWSFPHQTCKFDCGCRKT